MPISKTAIDNDFPNFNREFIFVPLDQITLAVICRRDVRRFDRPPALLAAHEIRQIRDVVGAGWRGESKSGRSEHWGCTSRTELVAGIGVTP